MCHQSCYYLGFLFFFFLALPNMFIVTFGLFHHIHAALNDVLCLRQNTALPFYSPNSHLIGVNHLSVSLILIMSY